MNPILMTDAYKQTHHLQYPEGTEYVYSYLESRGGPEETVFFGLQYYLSRYMCDLRVSQGDLEDARTHHMGMFGHTRYLNEEGWQYIIDEHNGSIPLRIEAVPEGTRVPSGNVLMTMVNTDPKVPWITNHFETLLLKVWYPITVASRSNRIKDSLKVWADMTGGSVSPFHLNDFGYRGVSSEESAMLGGMAHLTAFTGTDTIAGITGAMDYYNAPQGVGMSVMASEHSTTTIYGRQGEHKAMRSFIEKAGPGSIISLVADSYDYMYVVRSIVDNTHWGECISEAAANGQRVVIRPDSGDPVEMVRQTLQVLEPLAEENVAGYKVLPDYLGIIYGDGINEDTIQDICSTMWSMGWAIDGRNVVFGMGGGLLQQLDRDTHKFAIKCSAACVDGQWRDVFKQPKTDTGKNSKIGKLKLITNGNTYATVQEGHPAPNVLRTVFTDGYIVEWNSWESIQENLNRN